MSQKLRLFEAIAVVALLVACKAEDGGNGDTGETAGCGETMIPCTEDAACCEGLHCEAGLCIDCGEVMAPCGEASPCCGDLNCEGDVCTACAGEGAACGDELPCCDGLSCDAGVCVACVELSAPCNTAGPACCGPLKCQTIDWSTGRPASACLDCQGVDETCSDATECCDGLACLDNHCECSLGECSDEVPCCPGLYCVDYIGELQCQNEI